jgi:predicted DNA-binding transcriptional regulator AlpA
MKLTSASSAGWLLLGFEPPGVSPRGSTLHHHLDKRAAGLIAEGAGDPDDLLTTKDIGVWLGLSVTTLAIWRGKNKGPPFIRLGPRSVRYRRGDVVKWLTERRYNSTAMYR